MQTTRREMLKAVGLSAVAGALPSQSDKNQSSTIPSSFSSIEEVFRSSFIIDDLSGFKAQSDKPDAGFLVVRQSGATVVGPTLGDVLPEVAFRDTVEEISKQLSVISQYSDRM